MYIPHDSIDPTVFIEIVVETIDRVDLSQKIVGYAYFPLFLTPDANGPPLDINLKKYIFNEGYHQIPIYYTRIADKIPLTLERIQKLPKILCSTLLVRAFQSAMDKKGRSMNI